MNDLHPSVHAAYEDAVSAREDMTRGYDALRARHTEAVHALVCALKESGEPHAQSAAARLLKVSGTVVSRHMKRARAAGLTRTDPREVL